MGSPSKPKTMKRPAAAQSAEQIKKNPTARQIKKDPITKAAKSAARKPKGCNLPFPGVPTTHREKQVGDGVKIFTDLKMGAWRVQFAGDVKDKAFRWKPKLNPNPATLVWQDLCKYISNIKA